jgi:hypothetical protein
MYIPLWLIAVVLVVVVLSDEDRTLLNFIKCVIFPIIAVLLPIVATPWLLWVGAHDRDYGMMALAFVPILPLVWWQHRRDKRAAEKADARPTR